MKISIAKIILTGLLFFGVLGAYFMWFGIVQKKSAAVASLEEQIAAKASTVSYMAQARASLAEVASDEATLQNYFVPETEVVSFINELEALGHAQNATVNVLSVAKGGTGSQTGFTLSLTVNGSFDGVMRTLGAIEYAPYDLSVSTLTLAQADKSKWQANLNLFAGSVAGPKNTTTTRSL